MGNAQRDNFGPYIVFLILCVCESDVFLLHFNYISYYRVTETLFLIWLLLLEKLVCLVMFTWLGCESCCQAAAMRLVQT